MSNYKVKTTNARIEDLKEELIDEISIVDDKSKVVTVEPTAIEADRGKIITIAGTAGVADVVKICVKGNDDKYTYKTITIS